MIELLLEILTFGAKGFLVFLTVFACALVIFLLSRKGGAPNGVLHVKSLNDRWKLLADSLRFATMDPKEYKSLSKKEHKEEKKERKGKKNVQEKPKKQIFVLDFDGDMAASYVERLREEITGVLAVAQKGDEVVIRLESGGGMVHAYGLAASQLLRIKEETEKELRLTACIDKIAASGGYMMACIADEIIAAPFAVIGSIGVAAPVPNVHRLLKEHGVDYNEMTAGQYKRTVTMFGEITDEGREKFQDQLEQTHVLFKNFVGRHMPELDMETIATGEHWYGVDAHKLGLIHTLSTSDSYLIAQQETAKVFSVEYKHPKTLRDKLSESMSLAAISVFDKLLNRANRARYI